MNETTVTAVGRIATTIGVQRFDSGTVKASFRVACNERRRDWSTGEWVDGETLYLSVSCWRATAEHVAASMSMGDPVVVRGRMYTRTYETEGRRVSVIEMDASAVGPNLASCTAVVTRAPRSTRRTEEAAAAVAAAGHAAHRDWNAGPLVTGESEVDARAAEVGAAAGPGGRDLVGAEAGVGHR